MPGGLVSAWMAVELHPHRGRESVKCLAAFAGSPQVFFTDDHSGGTDTESWHRRLLF